MVIPNIIFTTFYLSIFYNIDINYIQKKVNALAQFSHQYVPFSTDMKIQDKVNEFAELFSPIPIQCANDIQTRICHFPQLASHMCTTTITGISRIFLVLYLNFATYSSSSITTWDEIFMCLQRGTHRSLDLGVDKQRNGDAHVVSKKHTSVSISHWKRSTSSCGLCAWQLQ